MYSHADGKFVTAEHAGTAALIANRTAVGAWEKFKLVTNADGSVGLRANANGRYVTAEHGGASALTANRTAASMWEAFDLRRQQAQVNRVMGWSRRLRWSERCLDTADAEEVIGSIPGSDHPH